MTCVQNEHRQSVGHFQVAAWQEDLRQEHVVMVRNRSGAENYHFRDSQTIANYARKAEKS